MLKTVKKILVIITNYLLFFNQYILDHNLVIGDFKSILRLIAFGQLNRAEAIERIINLGISEILNRINILYSIVVVIPNPN
mgnify:CR=1 FL=1